MGGDEAWLGGSGSRARGERHGIGRGSAGNWVEHRLEDRVEHRESIGAMVVRTKEESGTEENSTAARTAKVA